MSVQVLFCRLSQEQRELYQQYLDSKEVQAILAGNYKVCLVLFPFTESKVLVSRSERAQYARETMQVDRACNSKKRYLFDSK